MPALLHACVPLLSPASHARLRTESLVAWNRATQSGNLTHRAFAEAALGLKLETHAAVLGLQLLRSADMPGLQGGVRLEWGPTTAPGPEKRSLSAASLYMDLKATAYKRFVESYLNIIADGSSTSSLLLSGSGSSKGGKGGGGSPAVEWTSLGSPLTLLQLLAVSAPAAAGSMIKALLRSSAAAAASSSSSSSKSERSPSSAAAGLFKWELTMHASIGSMREAVQVTLPTQPGYRLLPHTVPHPHPLLLALSPQPLDPGQVVAVGQVKQLFSSFGWDGETAVASVLLPPAVMETSPAWARYITLCVVSEGGLEAVAASAVLSGLDSRRVAVTPPRALPEWRQLQLDCSLLDAAISGGDVGGNSSSSKGREWRSQMLVVGPGRVVVDVLAPAALDAAAAVRVAVTPTGQLTVTVGDPSSKAAQGGGVGEVVGGLLCAGEYTVQLPGSVFGGGQAEVGQKLRSSTRMSRALGLLSVTVCGGNEV